MKTNDESINQLDDSSDNTKNPRNSIPFEQWPEIMSHKQIMEYVGLSHAQAWKVLDNNRIYRPFAEQRRSMVVGKYALRDFLNGRVVEKEINREER